MRLRVSSAEIRTRPFIAVQSLVTDNAAKTLSLF